MLRLCLTVLLAFVSLTAAQEKVPDIEGTYDLKEFFENGKGSDERSQIRSVVFKDGTMTVKSDQREDVAKYTVDTGNPPFQIDFKPTTGEAKTTLGVWKVEKGELTVVFHKNGPRPTDFRGLGEGVVKFVMAKATPKRDK